MIANFVRFSARALTGAVLIFSQVPRPAEASWAKHLDALDSENLHQNEQEPALKELKKAVALDPGSAAAHQRLGEAYLKLGSYEMLSEAKAEFVQALAIDPKLIWSRFYLARIYLDLGRPQKAKEQLESALMIRPNIPHLLSLLGEANRKLGNIDISMEQNRKALEIDPSFFVAHYYLGLAYLDLKKEEEAIRELETAVKFSAAAEMCLTLGTVYFRKGDLDRAVELYQKAVAADPAKPEAHLRLAQAYHVKKLPDLAFEQLAQAYPEGQRFLNTPYYQQLQVEILFERGLIYQEKGALSLAAEAYSRVLQLDLAHGQAHRQLAAVLFQQGEYARALEHASKAAELKSPIAPSLLESIRAKLKLQ
ncbi:MAG TPA: tetratricopeptide repeat protein [Acidobacteriota bacterium]